MGNITNTNIHGSCLLGSQMFEYSYLIAVSLENPGTTPGFYLKNLPGMFGLLINFPFIHKPKIFEGECDYSGINYNPSDVLAFDRNYDIHFNFDYSIFHKHKEYLLNLYTFLPEIYSNCNTWIKDNSSPDELLVSIHFRRGDYLSISSLNLSLEYFYGAVETIKNKLPNSTLKFVCFSNDITWVKEKFVGIDNMIFVESLSDPEQMCLMSLCDHNIIANSSYSWWGAYLNKTPETITICPSSYGSADVISYYPDEWIRMNVL